MPRSKPRRTKKTTAPRPHLAGKPPSFRLYFFWMRGCHHCEKGKKHAAEFEKQHRAEGAVIRINAELRPKVGKFEPNGVPAYLLCIGEKEVMQHEGMLNLDELEDLLAQGREEYEKPEGEEEEEDEDVGDSEEDEEEPEEEEEDSSEDPEHDVIELVGGDDAEDDVPSDEDEELDDVDEDPDLATAEEESEKTLAGRAPKGAPTDLNLWTVWKLHEKAGAAPGDWISNRMEATSLAGARRLFKAGMLEIDPANARMRLTSSGAAAMRDWLTLHDDLGVEKTFGGDPDKDESNATVEEESKEALTPIRGKRKK